MSASVIKLSAIHIHTRFDLKLVHHVDIVIYEHSLHRPKDSMPISSSLHHIMNITINI